MVCVTDHHTLGGAHAALEHDLGVRVVVGEEIRTPAGEVIGLFLDDRIPYVLPLDEVVARIKAQQGIVYAPHACDQDRAALGEEHLARLAAAGTLDVVETFNAKVADDTYNKKAAKVARRLGIAEAAGSDAHDAAGIGAAYVEMPDFDGPRDFLTGLAAGRIVGELRPHAPRYGASRARGDPAVPPVA
ncbi:MAG: phosphotransferase [Streptosporangiales bacterium]|nr:phosphotransferase [Streptosporangiales bacterium]